MCVSVFTYGGFDFSVGRHEGMSLLHDTAGEVANLRLLLSIIGVLYLHTVYNCITSCNHKKRIIDRFFSPLTYTASPEEVPSVFKHSVDVDKLSMSDGDEPAVSRVVVLQCSSYQDGICSGMWVRNTCMFLSQDMQIEKNRTHARV